MIERVRDCPVCEGDGCCECGDTGQKVRTHIDAGDGITLSVSGDAPLTPGARAALAALARVAFDRMDAQEACAVCGASPHGRYDPPAVYDGDCPHGCSPER